MNRFNNYYKICILLFFIITQWLIIADIAAATSPALSNNAVKPKYTIADEAVCLPCHGSEKFATDPKYSKFYIEKRVMKKTLHKNVTCIECHTDLTEFARMYASLGLKIKESKSRWVRSLFLVTPIGIRHSGHGQKLYTTANLSCRNCKEHAQQGIDYFSSIHSFVSPASKKQIAPTCNTCHGSHYITRSIKKNAAFRASTHSNAKKLCGSCHPKSFESYNDPYHGRPYKVGAPSAPACWDCHGAHLVSSKKDSKSMVAKSALSKTCGKCHKDSIEAFTSYSTMVHGREELLNENPVVRHKNKIAKWIDDNIVSKIEKKYIDPLQSFLTTKYKEYLSDRDKSVTIPTRSD